MATTAVERPRELEGLRFLAVYENGMLRPEVPLGVPEGTELTLTVGPGSGRSLLDETRGMIKLSAPEAVQREILGTSVLFIDDACEEAE